MDVLHKTSRYFTCLSSVIKLKKCETIKFTLGHLKHYKFNIWNKFHFCSMRPFVLHVSPKMLVYVAEASLVQFVMFMDVIVVWHGCYTVNQWSSRHWLCWNLCSAFVRLVTILQYYIKYDQNLNFRFVKMSCWLC